MALPQPKLTKVISGQVPHLTDHALFEAAGVRIAFTGRAGGFSQPPFAELNLSEWVGDSPDSVVRNREHALAALGGEGCALLVPKQVHGADVFVVQDGSPRAIQAAAEEIAEGADGLIVRADNVAAMLGFADCIPVMMVSPDRSFAVVHAGWRGVMQGIAPKALGMLCDVPSHDACSSSSGGQPHAASAPISPSDINIYIGPHIRRECFETSEDVHSGFVDAFGEDVAFGPRHIDLNAALHKSLVAAGANPDRIADADICTVCDSDRFFSYRASGGTCGRHGAIAFREPISNRSAALPAESGSCCGSAAADEERM